LNISRVKLSSQKPIIIPPITTIINSPPTTIDFKITGIHYGTLITGAAMRNIQRRGSIVSNNDEFGIIANHLINDDYKTSFSFEIDTEKKKLAIIGEFDLVMTIVSEVTGALKFEWNFRE
jgi:hypothetical protein